MEYDYRRPEEGSLLWLAQRNRVPSTVGADLAASFRRPGFANARTQRRKLRHRLSERRIARSLGTVTEGVDFSYTISQATAQAMWNAGKRTLFVYTKWTGKPSIEMYRGIGFAVKPIYETTGTDYRGGRAAGNNAAHANVAWAQYNGYNPQSTVNAFDEDVLGYGRGGLAIDYDAGWCDVQGLVDSYAQGQLLDLLHLRGVMRFGWQTYAWSGGYVNQNGYCVAYQNPNDIWVAGINCDRDRTWAVNIGAIGQGAPPPTPVPTTNRAAALLL